MLNPTKLKHLTWPLSHYRNKIKSLDNSSVGGVLHTDLSKAFTLFHL